MSVNNNLFTVGTYKWSKAVTKAEYPKLNGGPNRPIKGNDIGS